MTTQRSGQFIKQLKGVNQYKAFIPNALPFNITNDLQLQDLLSKANLALGRLDGIAETLPEVNFFIFMYVRKEATLSSQIEGTQATFTDVLKAEVNIEENNKDVDEIINYISAMNYGLDRLKTLPLSLRLIKEIHEKLLVGVRGKNKNPGNFRTTQNWIGGATIETASFVPPPSNEIMGLLGNLESFLHDKSFIPTLIKIGLVHYQFETIHPFLDGNGRIGRLLITFYLCQQGALKKPLLYLSEFFLKNRREYYDKLENVQSKDDIEGWLKFFLTGIAQTSENALKTATRILKLKEQDTFRISSLGRTTEKGMIVLSHLYTSPYVRVKDIEHITGLKNPNALLLVSRLMKLGILKEVTGKSRNRIFLYENYVRIFE